MKTEEGGKYSRGSRELHRCSQGILSCGHGRRVELSKSQYRRVIYTIAAVCTWVLWTIGNNHRGLSSTAARDYILSKSDLEIHGLLREGSLVPVSSPEEIKNLFIKIEKQIQHVLKSNKKFTKFGPRILDWDKRRHEIAKQKLFVTPAAGRTNFHEQQQNSTKPRILLVTSTHPHACSNKKGDRMQLLAIKNKLDYCRLHNNVQIFYNMNKMDDEMVGWWVKLFLTHMLMIQHPEVDWIWWMDSDTVITDTTFELPMHKYENHNMVVSGWEDAVYEKRSWMGLNAGVFLLRNCQWSLDLLHAWAPLSPKGPVRDAIGTLLSYALVDRPPSEADDQSSLVYLMLTDRSRWGSKIYLESSYCFQGYWLYLTDKFEGMMKRNEPGLYGDERWPFVTHFVGCEFCEGGINPAYAPRQCITAMERAFNFADNQVLQRYGMRHSSLQTSQVQRLSTNSDSPSPPQIRNNATPIVPNEHRHDTDRADDSLHVNPTSQSISNHPTTTDKPSETY